MSQFYGTLAQVSFTVFGLWLVVVQLERKDETAGEQHRWGERVVAMHFALPGVMSLLILADPENSLLWQLSFAAFAVLGGVGMALLGHPEEDPGPVASLLRWGAVALYWAVAGVALFARGVAAALGVNALQVEAVLLSLLLFVGLNQALAMIAGGTSSASTSGTDA
jgi:undecaprenyl pyrophosphate phosphatase UppP